jgi:4-hydroxy-tetrahydrodipicolinate synthase
MSYAMKNAHCIGPDFALYSGNDDITVPLMSIGGSGVISVYANVMPDVPRDRGGLPGGKSGPAVENHLST